MIKNLIIKLMFLGILASHAYATSLFDEDTYESVVAQQLDYEVGDLITVLIYEASSASNSATTDTDTKTGVGLNYGKDIISYDRTINVDNEFEGGGKVNREGKVIASMSVAITEIKPNGDYKIMGEQNISLNNESQFIKVTGFIRARDISNENTILSTRIAEADIEFKGQGLLSSTEKPGLITKFFNWLF